MPPVPAKGKFKAPWFSSAVVSVSSEIVGYSIWPYGLSCLWADNHFPFQHLSPCLFLMLYSSSWWCYPLSASLPRRLCEIYSQAPSLCAERDNTLRTSSLGNCYLETVPPARLTYISPLQVPHFPTLRICVAQKTESVIQRENKMEEMFLSFSDREDVSNNPHSLKNRMGCLVREEAHHLQNLPRSDWSNTMRWFLHC